MLRSNATRRWTTRSSIRVIIKICWGTAAISQRLQLNDASSDSALASLPDLHGKSKLSVMDASHLNFVNGIYSDPVAALREICRVCEKGEAPASGAEASSGLGGGVVGHPSGRVLLLGHPRRQLEATRGMW